MNAGEGFDPPTARSRPVPINGTDLFVREIGQGPPIIVLHGGPDFDHAYLLPELDRLSDSFRLIYYDQRGRGRSAAGVRPEDVGIDSELADLDGLRRHFGLGTVAVLGHSWGGVLALEYARRHPASVSHLVLMNTAPASGWEAEQLRTALAAGRTDDEIELMREIVAGAPYEAGDVQAELDFYRVHFGGAVASPDHVEQVVRRLRTHFTPAGVILARAIEQRLYHQTWLQTGYDLVPGLRDMPARTLVLHGERDLVPVRMAARIADAISASELCVLEGAGHFAYLERPEATRDAVRALILS